MIVRQPGLLQGRRDILGSSNFKYYHFEAERVGCILNLTRFEHRTGVVDVGQYR